MTIKTDMQKVNNVDLHTSVNAIYKYIYENFVESSTDAEQMRRVKRDFENRDCLWDEDTKKFWKPKYAFQEDVSFFGDRRVRINNLSHQTKEVYLILGQRRSPGVEDYLEFLQELANEYNNTPLSEEDKSCALQVLQRLESQLSLEKRSEKNLFVLTDENRLRLANEVLIPDAPWRKNYIDPNRILHCEVPPKLAKDAGSLSLLRDVIERPTEVNRDFGTEVNKWCQQWQNTLNSPEFFYGLKRLVFHEHDLEIKVSINSFNVLPSSQIKVDLFLDDNTLIAAGVPGDYYFDKEQRIFHLIHRNSKDTMVGYLAESFNNQLSDKYALKNLLPLARMIDSEPRNIRSLLNDLRIRSLPGDNESIEILKSEEIETDTLTTNESFQEVTTPELPASSQTDVGRSNNSYEWGAFGEQWAERFYQWLKYTSIVKQPDRMGFDFLCNGSGLPEITSEVKTITSNRPNIRITVNEWAKMFELGKSYELLIISHQGEEVNEIIQIRSLWETLIYTFKHLNFRSLTTIAHNDENAEVILGFHPNSDKQRNDIIVSWHRLIQCVPYENIKKYRPVSSMVVGKNKSVKFEPI